MAALPPVSRSPEVAAHYATQAGLSLAVLAALQQFRDLLDLTSPSRYLAALSAIVSEFSRASISLSADFYEDLREAAGVGGRFSPVVVEPWVEQQVAAYVKASAADLRSEPQALLQMEGVARGMVLDAGRRQLLSAAEQDDQARGWARVTRPGACAFCRMLATRGAAYKSETTAEFRAHTPHDGGGGVCQCGVEPIFGRYEAPAHILADQVLWSESTDGIPSRDNGKLNAFRRAIAEQETSR